MLDMRFEIWDWVKTVIPLFQIRNQNSDIRNSQKNYLCAIMSKSTDELFKNVIAHCKEYGFVFPSSEIYDGLSAVYDYGQNGAELKNNIKEYWWKFMTLMHENI